MTAASPERARARDHSLLHRAGGAWTDRGTACLVSAAPGSREDAVRCHRRAIDLLRRLPVDENAAYLADLGAAWVNLGCALQACGDKAGPGGAVDAFDRGIELLERLPIADNFRFRHNLAAAWMGRADALAVVGTDAACSGALRAYDRAIEVARRLPMEEKASHRILLASCGINRGNLRQRAGDAGALSAAVESYDGALAALGTLPQSGHRLACHHAATAWANRGAALLLASAGDNAGQAVDSARMSLAQIEGRDLVSPASAELQLRALRVMAGGLETLLLASGPAPRADTVAAMSNLAERGIALAVGCRERAPGQLDPYLAWFFGFGSRIYGRYQPQFLAEFLDEVLGRWNDRAGPEAGAELRSIAGQAVAAALQGLGRDRMWVEGTRHTALLMSTVHELRRAAPRFEP